MLNKLCLLEWELTRRYRSRSAILFDKKMRRLNQISRTYSFESTQISIWFGVCKMRRLSRDLKPIQIDNYSWRKTEINQSYFRS